MVYIIWETGKVDGLLKMISDPDLAEKMKEAGVTSQPEMVLLN
jgi:hypothetical protein